MEDHLDKDKKLIQLEPRYLSPFKLILIISFSIVFCELLVMFLLPAIPFFEGDHSWAESFIDAILLVIFLSPFIYFFILNPLIHHISYRQTAEKNLKSHLLNLEKIVAQRTQKLQIANKNLHETIIQHKNTESLLRHSEEKFRRVFDNLQDGYLWADGDGNILLANMFAANILGYDLQELMQKNMAQDIYFVPEERETVKKIMVQNGKIENYELTFKRKDGQKIFVEANSHLVYDDNQQNSMEGTFRDITSRKRAEEEKALLEAQLRQAAKIEAVGTLAGGIAHDFNNILSVIIGYSELLKEDIKENDSSMHFVNQVLQGGQRAKELVSQILLFSRQSEHEMVQVKIIPLVKEVIKMLTASLPSTIDIKINILTMNDFILADPIQIHQILLNLCTNSAHAMRKNGGTLSIEIDQKEIGQVLLPFGLPAKPDSQNALRNHSL